MYYDAVQALIKALKLNPNPTRANIQQTLKSSNFSAAGAGDTIKFLPSGDRKTQVQLLEIQKVDKISFSNWL